MTEPETRKRVLFVCYENCNRSQIAEAFARMYGAGRVEACSAGCRPALAVHPKAIAAMQELGFDLGQQRPKGVSALSDVEFDVVVTMGCGDKCPALKTKQREDWDIPVPKEMPPEQFRAVRDEIGQRVKELVVRLSGSAIANGRSM